MSTISKVFVVMNIVLAMFLLGTVAAILAKTEDYKGRYETEVAAKTQLAADKDAEIAGLTSNRNNLDSQNRSLKTQKADLESQNQTLTSERDQARADNNQLRNDVTAINTSIGSLQGQLQDVEGRNKELMDRNEQYRQVSAQAEQAKMSAEDDRARLEGDLQRANDDIAGLETSLTALAADRDNLRAEREALVSAGVPVEQIIGNVVPQIEGRVSEVGPGFVVLSVGEEDGVKLGYPFHVYRGAHYIGQVVVTDVHPDTAVARVQMKNKMGLAFQATDVATTRL